MIMSAASRVLRHDLMAVDTCTAVAHDAVHIPCASRCARLDGIAANLSNVLSSARHQV